MTHYKPATDPGVKKGDGKRRSRVYNGDPGADSQLGPGTESLVRDSESFLAFERRMELAKLTSSPYFAVSKVFYGSPVLQERDENGGSRLEEEHSAGKKTE